MKTKMKRKEAPQQQPPMVEEKGIGLDIVPMKVGGYRYREALSEITKIWALGEINLIYSKKQNELAEKMKTVV